MFSLHFILKSSHIFQIFRGVLFPNYVFTHVHTNIKRNMSSQLLSVKKRNCYTKRLTDILCNYGNNHRLKGQEENEKTDLSNQLYKII